MRWTCLVVAALFGVALVALLVAPLLKGDSRQFLSVQYWTAIFLVAVGGVLFAALARIIQLLERSRSIRVSDFD